MKCTKDKEQRKLLHTIDKRTMERMEIMRSFDETNEKKKIERRRRIDRDDDHMENNNMRNMMRKASSKSSTFDNRSSSQCASISARLGLIKKVSVNFKHHHNIH